MTWIDLADCLMVFVCGNHSRQSVTKMHYSGWIAIQLFVEYSACCVSFVISSASVVCFSGSRFRNRISTRNSLSLTACDHVDPNLADTTASRIKPAIVKIAE